MWETHCASEAILRTAGCLPAPTRSPGSTQASSKSYRQLCKNPWIRVAQGTLDGGIRTCAYALGIQVARALLVARSGALQYWDLDAATVARHLIPFGAARMERAP